MENEFVALSDLALSKGIKHSDLIEAISEAVLAEYQRKYPNSPKDALAIVDERTGNVRLIQGKSDVTPLEFVPLAAQIARQVIIGKLQETPVKPVQELKVSTLSNWLSLFIFWGYNSLYLVFIIIFLLGLLSGDFRKHIFESLANLGFYRGMLFAILLTAPLASIVIAIKTKLNKEPSLLGKLFFILEIPLVTFSFISINVFTNPTGAVWFFSLVLLSTPAVLYIYLVKPKITSLKQHLAFLFCQESIFLTFSYFSLLFSFFLPLIIASLIKVIIGDLFPSPQPIMYEKMGMIQPQPQPVWYLFSLLIPLFFGALGLLFVVFLSSLPFLLAFVFGKMFLKTRSTLIPLLTREKANTITAVFGAVFFCLTLILSYQPDISSYIKKLEKLNTQTTFETREEIAAELIPHEKKIRQGLKDMYNARTRYLISKDDDIIAQGYEQVFNFDPEVSQYIQSSFITLAFPFVYQGPVDTTGEMAKTYQYLFGHPIEEDAYKTPEQKQVLLVSRAVNVKTDYQGLLATVVVEEEYVNKTYQQQEVIYEFSLPADSVITDLKLGANLEFTGLIAPKGAARQTYEREVNRRKDPALLEQTGPRQYRLRIFPVPGLGEVAPTRDIPLDRVKPPPWGKNLKVQFTYQTAANTEGYPLPVYTKTTNLLLDKTSQLTYFLNGVPVTVKENSQFVKDPKTNGPLANLCKLTGPVSGRTSYPSFSASLLPHWECDQNTKTKVSSLADNLRIAILYDVSYDNKSNPFPEELRQLLRTNKDLLKKNRIDLYLFNDYLSQEKNVTPALLEGVFDITYFGKSDLLEAIKSFNGQYDFAVIVTGKTDSLAGKNIAPLTAFPLYLVHSNRTIPSYGGRFTTYLVQNKGLVVDNLEEAINHFVFTKERKNIPDNSLLLTVGSYWSIILSPKGSLIPDYFVQSVQDGFFTKVDDPLTYLASQAYLKGKVANFKGVIEGNLSFLDNTNSFAGKNNIVTPYSSLIALVNEEQRRELERQAQNYNRYEEDKPVSFNPRPILGPMFLERGMSTPLDIVNPSMSQMKIGGGGGGMLGSISPNTGIGFASPFLGLFIGLNILLVGLGILLFVILNVKKLLASKKLGKIRFPKA